MNFKLVLASFLALWIQNADLHADGPAFYVSPTGSPRGDGSLNAPWDLQTALDQPRAVMAGSTIWVLPGTYRGKYVSRLNGTAGAPIVVRAQLNERVFLDGNHQGVPDVMRLEGVEPVVRLMGSHTWLWGFDIGNSDAGRTISEAGSNPVTRRATAVSVDGPNTKVINCLLHDCGDGLSASRLAVDAEFYGNVIFHNGWAASDRRHGHGVYCQNETGRQTFRDNIILHNFVCNLHLYGTSKAFLNNFQLEGNVVLDGHSILGGATPMQRCELISNYFYNERPQFGYQSTANDGLILRDNIFPSGLSLQWWKNVTATGNLIFNKAAYVHVMNILQAGPIDLSTYHFDKNIYCWSNPGPAYPPSPGVYFQNTALPESDPGKYLAIYLSDWQRRGQDKNATLLNMPMVDSLSMRLTGKKIMVRRNKYDPARANVVVYNWDRDEVVSLNVGDILTPGDRYELRNAQDWFADVVSGTYQGGDLRIPMSGHSVAKPLGWNESLAPTSFPEFGAFTLIVSPKK